MAFIYPKYRGQALIEFIVWSIALIPIALMIPLLGKFADINQATLQASRYAAWKKTVTTQEKINPKNDGFLASEIRARFFANEGRSIRTNDTVIDLNKQNYNAFYEAHNGERLIKNLTDIEVRTASEKPLFGDISSVLSGLNTRFFKLSDNNFWSSYVDVNISFLNFSDKLNLKISWRNTLLTDAWEAGNQSNEIIRLKDSSAVSASLLSRALPFDSATEALFSMIEPSFKDLDFNRTGPDQLPVPKDRR